MLIWPVITLLSVENQPHALMFQPLLHAMTAMSCTHPFQQPAGDLQIEDEDDENARPLPVTS